MSHFDESKIKRSGDGKFAEKERSHSGVSLPVPESDPHTPSAYAEGLESISKNWPGAIRVTTNTGPGHHHVTASHQPNMGTTIEFSAHVDEDNPHLSSWQWDVDGETLAEGPIDGEENIARAEMYQDAFVGQAEDDDALYDNFSDLQSELGPRGYRVETGWGDFVDDYTEEHSLIITEPDGGAWEVLQHRRDPRVADMQSGPYGQELFEAEHGNCDYVSEHYISRINPDGTRESLEGEESYETMSEAVTQIRQRTNGFTITASTPHNQKPPTHRANEIHNVMSSQGGVKRSRTVPGRPDVMVDFDDGISHTYTPQADGGMFIKSTGPSGSSVGTRLEPDRAQRWFDDQKERS